MVGNTAEGKQAMRRRALAVRDGLAPSVLVHSRRALADLLGPVLRDATAVASYLPRAGEPGLAPQPGWLLPVLRPDSDLDWAAYDGRLAPGRLGLLEPTGPRLGVAAIARCGVVLVPALLVDTLGNRLGRGGGSYDRALPRARGLLVALLHDGELVDRVPIDDHDVPVHEAASPAAGLQRLRERCGHG